MQRELGISQLKVAEIVKAEQSTEPTVAVSGEVLTIETCQRVLKIWMGDSGSEYYGVLSGAAAYERLLKITCGLASRVVGETDVFGQIKESWSRFGYQTSGSLRGLLTPVMMGLFEDAKEIRTAYLQNLGGTSYGALVRKLIYRHQTNLGEPVLVIGAGLLARSIAPYLKEFEIEIYNRTQERARSLCGEMKWQSSSAIGEQDLPRAWRECSHVVICIPYDKEMDRKFALWWREGDPRGGGRSVVHLGIDGTTDKSASDAWKSECNHFYDLSDVYSIQAGIDQERQTMVERALAACHRKSELREILLKSKNGFGFDDVAGLY